MNVLYSDLHPTLHKHFEISVDHGQTPGMSYATIQEMKAWLTETYGPNAVDENSCGRNWRGERKYGVETTSLWAAANWAFYFKDAGTAVHFKLRYG